MSKGWCFTAVYDASVDFAHMDALTAMRNAGGPIVSRLRNGEVLWQYNASDVLRRFAKWCAPAVQLEKRNPLAWEAYEMARVAAWGNYAVWLKQNDRLHRMLIRGRPKEKA